MNTKSPPFLPVFITGISLTVLGLSGLAAIFILSLPTLGPRWLFFFLTLITFSGIALPIVHFLNRRFSSQPPADSSVLIRQALWVGIYLDIIAWLQMGGMLNLAQGIFLASGIGLIEFLLRMRERSHFTPQGEEAPNE